MQNQKMTIKFESQEQERRYNEIKTKYGSKEKRLLRKYFVSIFLGFAIGLGGDGWRCCRNSFL